MARAPSGWKDGGGTFWIKSSAYGQKYKCKTCGREALGRRYDGEHNHRRNCASEDAIHERGRAALNLFYACLPALRVAARNLAIAGALDHSFELGRAYGQGEEATRGFWDDPNLPWWPNTAGRPAPGTGGTTP